MNFRDQVLRNLNYLANCIWFDNQEKVKMAEEFTSCANDTDIYNLSKKYDQLRLMRSDRLYQCI